MKKITKYLLSFILIFAFTSCGGGSTKTIVEENQNEQLVVEKIQFDVTVEETVKYGLALTSDSPTVPIEIPSYTFTASVTNIEPDLTIRLTIDNGEVSTHKELLSSANEPSILTYYQSRTRPIEIKVKVYDQSDKDNFTEKEFVFNGFEWLEK